VEEVDSYPSEALMPVTRIEVILIYVGEDRFPNKNTISIVEEQFCHLLFLVRITWFVHLQVLVFYAGDGKRVAYFLLLFEEVVYS